MQQTRYSPGQLRLEKGEGDERGQSMVEFALTIPIIIITLIAVVGFAWILYDYVALSSAVREGAYFVIIDPNVTDEAVIARVKESAGTLNPDQMNITICVINKEDGSQDCSPGAISKIEGGDVVSVSVVYRVNLPSITLPYIITEGSITLFPPLDLRAEAKMRLD